MSPDVEVTWPEAGTIWSQVDVEDVLQAWRDARDEAADAYAAWCAGGPPGRRLAYAVYLAAAEREATAERICRLALDAGADRPR